MALRLPRLIRAVPRPWIARREPEESGLHGPRIAVIGNCQAKGVAEASRILLPGARVRLIPMSTLGRRAGGLDAFAATLGDCDHVFCQPFPAGFFPEGGSEALRARLPRMRLFPAIVFTAFHPDAVYVGDLASVARVKLVPSPLGTYHSAITLFGFLQGLPRERIVGLFREEVFSRLGYLDAWDLAAADLIASSRAIGFDLSGELLRWSRGGLFMHNINHPRLSVLGDVAERLLREAGLAPRSVAVEAYAPDALLDDPIWPVYPPVATLYGVAGSTVFKRRQRRGAAPETLSLDAFVAESLAIYRDQPRERLTCHRVEHWRGLPDVRALFES
ncbi:UNVERIFIED_CONTAM: WcbI family polysaccharide biosynthesis putative acetyltransferase [Methylobacteriaceae bacterium AG10]|nr:WcbI family polysaccharide biosynthesis putative acetyltransferase [Methylobacteriaceae bacterium AG10]